MDDIAARLIDLLLLAGAGWIGHRVTARASGEGARDAAQAQTRAAHHEARAADDAAFEAAHGAFHEALAQTAQVIRNQAQLLGEYSKLLDVLRDHRDQTLHTVAAAVADAVALGLRTGPAGATPAPGELGGHSAGAGTSPPLGFGRRTDGRNSDIDRPEDRDINPQDVA